MATENPVTQECSYVSPCDQPLIKLEVDGRPILCPQLFFLAYALYHQKGLEAATPSFNVPEPETPPKIAVCMNANTHRPTNPLNMVCFKYACNEFYEVRAREKETLNVA